jgi:LysM repeat protein
MKWRDWQLLIILLLLAYIAVSITLTWPAQQQPAPPPTLTAHPTVAQTSTPIDRGVTPTHTPQPTSTPATTSSITPTSPAPPTVASSATPSPQPSFTATATTAVIQHTVQRGENLTGIAQQYGTTVQAIVEANTLANPDQIFIGQTLRIPLPSAAPTPPGQ